jgi:hypothetical protein
MLYSREVHGATLTVHGHDSEALRGNPLGDPAERHSPLLVPADGGAGLPLVVVLVGYTGFGHKVLNRPSLWSENLPGGLPVAFLRDPPRRLAVPEQPRHRTLRGLRAA